MALLMEMENVVIPAKPALAKKGSRDPGLFNALK